MKMRERLRTATTFKEWREAAINLDDEEGCTRWRSVLQSGEYDWRLVLRTTRNLAQLRAESRANELMSVLGAVMNRRFGGIDSSALYRRAHAGTKLAIERFLGEVEESIAFIQAFPESEAEWNRRS